MAVRPHDSFTFLFCNLACTLALTTACGGEAPIEPLEPSMGVMSGMMAGCRLAASAETLEFELHDRRGFVLQNLGGGLCVVDRVFLDRRTFQIQDEPGPPWAVQPNGSRTLIIGFEPQYMLPRGDALRELQIRGQHELMGLSVLLVGKH